jgi:hypothetical protein
MKHHNSSFMSVFISLTMLFFGLLVALFLLKMVLGAFLFFAPVVGLVIAGMGGVRYVKADTEAEKLSAMKWVAVGLGVILVRIIIF